MLRNYLLEIICKIKNCKIKKVAKGGFSIAEVVLSVFIVGTVLVVVVGLMASSIRHSMGARDQIIASALAQEGVELVRNLRDNNWAQGDESFEYNFPDDTANNCVVDLVLQSSCSDDNVNNRYKMKYIGGFYRKLMNGGSYVKFRRRVMIAYETGKTGTDSPTATVTSLVTWNNSNPPSDTVDCSLATKCTFVSTVLTRWGE